jgi:hypothetical protein
MHEVAGGWGERLTLYEIELLLLKYFNKIAGLMIEVYPKALSMR